MEKTQLKVVCLNYQELNMAYTMLRCNEVNSGKVAAAHESLFSKIISGKRAAIASWTVRLLLEDAERKVMRDCNTSYCSILANQLDWSDTNGIPEAEIIEIYELATRIQLLFSSQH